jgi:SSS family solute:Na+ symporter
MKKMLSPARAAKAWACFASLVFFALGGIAIQQLWPNQLAPLLMERFPENTWLAEHAAKFPLNGTYLGFIAMLVASASYVLVSLLGPRTDFDMDWLLHRGKYAVAQDVVKGDASIPRRRNFGEILGLSHEFSRGDKAFFWASFYWSIGWWLLFVVVTALNIFWKMPDGSWCGIWAFKIWISVVLGIGMTIWFLYGGIKDALRLFRDLRAVKLDEHDDGTVEHRPDDSSAAKK